MSRILEAIAVTAELTGTEMSRVGLLAMEAEIGAYPEAAALEALARCRREIKGRLTLADVLERLAVGDGRPGADEAWASVILADDEAETVVWCEEMRVAFGAARPLLEQGDKIGARMAFRDAYERLVRSARADRVPVCWSPSLGWDIEKRRAALGQAVQRGLLEAGQIAGLLPPPDGGPIQALLEGKPLRLIAEHGSLVDAPEGERERTLEHLRNARAMLMERARR